MRTDRLLRAIPILVGVLCTTAPALADGPGLVAARSRVQASPSNAEAIIAYGRALRQSGREAEALNELRRGVTVAAEWPNLVARMEWEIARTYIAQREFQPAMATCRAMGRRASAKAESHVCAAEAHLLWRRGTEAEGELKAAAKYNDRAEEIVYAAAMAEGRILELGAKDAEAEAAYLHATQISPKRAEAHVLLGVLQNRVGKDGLTALRRAVEVEPNNPEALLALASASPFASPDAITALERAVAERPTYTEAMRLLAASYVGAGRLPKAKETVDALLRLAPNDAESHVVAARVAFAGGRLDDALHEGEKASKLMPNSAGAKLIVADVWAKKGEIDLALEAYQAAFGADPLDPTSLIHAARACIAAGRLTSAKAFAARATKDFPADGAGWVTLGDVLVHKDRAAAKRAYEKARTLKGVDVRFVDSKLGELTRTP